MKENKIIRRLLEIKNGKYSKKQLHFDSADGMLKLIEKPYPERTFIEEIAEDGFDLASIHQGYF